MSIHAAAAVLFVRGCWHFRLLRLTAVVLKGAMAGTAFVEGLHYLVDILAGVLVAMPATVLVYARAASKMWRSAPALHQKRADSVTP